MPFGGSSRGGACEKVHNLTVRTSRGLPGNYIEPSHFFWEALVCVGGTLLKIKPRGGGPVRPDVSSIYTTTSDLV